MHFNHNSDLMHVQPGY